MTTADGKLQLNWIFERCPPTTASTAMILVRVLIGKVARKERLESVLESVPIRADQSGWNCVEWVREAVLGLERDGRALGTCETSWDAIRDTAMRYVEEKRSQHRFDGRGEFDMSKIATWDLLERKETIE